MGEPCEEALGPPCATRGIAKGCAWQTLAYDGPKLSKLSAARTHRPRYIRLRKGIGRKLKAMLAADMFAGG